MGKRGPKPSQVKRCPKCGEENLSKFGKNIAQRDGLQTYCKDCQSKMGRKASRAYHLRNKYGLTLDTYVALFEKQGGKCAICRREPAPGYPLSIDHDHSCCPGKKTCGKCIRGLLCVICNSFLGRCGDDIAVFEAAIAYVLQRNSTTKPFVEELASVNS